jgi:predicted CxxxxCH...CXXCH cytochrome family protein
MMSSVPRTARAFEEVCMLRVASVWTAAAFAYALAGCGDARTIKGEAVGAQSAACANCHSSEGEPPPFRDADGSIEANQLNAGSHDAHVGGALSAPIACSVCHPVPRSVSDAGHLEDNPSTDVRFGSLATTGGATPTYSRPTCSATYCHGSIPGGSTPNLSWTGTKPVMTCSSCHGFPPPTGIHVAHVELHDVQCTQCHGAVLTATHVNGQKDLDQAVVNFNPATRLCAAVCHSGEIRLWPPLP